MNVDEVAGDHIVLHGWAHTVRIGRDAGSELVANEVWTQDCYRLAGRCDGRTVIDIGANVGAVSLAAVAFGAERVVAVEPDAINLDQLRRNVGLLDDSADDLASRVEVHHAAVGRPGQVQVHRGHASGCYGNSFTAPPEPGAATVTQRPLEDFLVGSDLVVKIDVEGAEYEILAGAGIDMLAARVEWLVLEWHHFPDRGIDMFEQLPHLVSRLQRRYDVELVGPPERGGLLFATRR